MAQYKKKFLTMKESACGDKPKRHRHIIISREQLDALSKEGEKVLNELDIAVSNTSADMDTDVKKTYQDTQRELGSTKASQANYVIPGEDVHESKKVALKKIQKFLREYNENEMFDTYHDVNGSWNYQAVSEDICKNVKDKVVAENVKKMIPLVFEKKYQAKVGKFTKAQLKEDYKKHLDSLKK